MPRCAETRRALCAVTDDDLQPITSLSIRQQRPFRAVSGSDDKSIVFHTGVPFKYDKIISTHTRFVRDVGFSPNGDLFASVGSDGKIFFYDGKTGDVKSESVGVDPSRSLMALSWSPDSSKVATAGADGVVAIWDAATSQIAQTYILGADVGSQQNGVVYANTNTVVSVSNSGVLNIFDTREPSAKWRKLQGPTKAVTVTALTGSGKDQTFYTGSFDGSMKAFTADGMCWDVTGAGHSSRIVGLAPNGAGKVYSAGWDDKVSSIAGTEYAAVSIPTKSQPTGVAATPTAVYVSSAEGLEIAPTSGSSVVHPGAATAVAAFTGPNGDIVAVGAGTKKVALHGIIGTTLSPIAEFDDNKGDVLALAFSADGALLAAGDSAGRLVLIDVVNKKVLVSSRWTFHTGRIASVSFSPSGKRIVTGGADESIYVWTVDKITRNVPIKNAHPGGVAGVAWESDTKILSSGADGCVRTWEVPE